MQKPNPYKKLKKKIDAYESMTEHLIEIARKMEAANQYNWDIENLIVELRAKLWQIENEK